MRHEMKDLGMALVLWDMKILQKIWAVGFIQNYEKILFIDMVSIGRMIERILVTKKVSIRKKINDIGD